MTFDELGLAEPILRAVVFQGYAMPDVRRVIAKLPSRRQTLLFCATMPEPIERLAAAILRDPQRTLEDFKTSRTPVLVATDIAARGIDV